MTMPNRCLMQPVQGIPLGVLAPRVWVVDDDRAVASALARVLRTAAVDVEVMHAPVSLLERLDLGAA